MIKKDINGITLIALVITIIVLLILAGVTIQVLNGNNGVLTKAEEAKNVTIRTGGLEKIELAVVASYDNKYINTTLLAKNLSQIDGLTDEENKKITENTKITLPKVVKLNGIEYVINDDGKLENLGDEKTINVAKITAEVVGMDDTEKLKYYQGLYGKTVDYKPIGNIQTSTDVANTPKTAKWKIFYVDKRHIYLISDGFVTYDSLPKYLNDDGTVSYEFKKSDENNLYRANFTNIIGKYNNGIGDINLFSKADELKLLNNDFFNWINPESGLKETLGTSYSNMKAIAVMLDSDFWDTKYKDNKGYAEYTIGGATIEMLIASYNQTHDTNYGALAFKKNEKNENNESIAYADGYKISKDADANRTTSDWKYGDSILDGSKEIYSTLYRNYNHSAANGVTAYWLASPTAIRNNGVMWVRHNGTVEGYYYGSYTDAYVAFRPLICLKSNVQLKESDDKEYDYKLK